MSLGGALQEKNVSTAVLDGKVGRMYVPRQEVGSIATFKMKVILSRPPSLFLPCALQGRVVTVYRT